MSSMIHAEDISSINHIVAAYGHIVDAKEWARLSELFTDDLVFVPWQKEAASITSLEGLIALWSAPEFPHPTGHHATNILIEPADNGVVAVTWKGISVHRNGQSRSLIYRARLRRTDEGWRGFWLRVEQRPTDVRPDVASVEQHGAQLT